jgi:hypothetical protein
MSWMSLVATRSAVFIRMWRRGVAAAPLLAIVSGPPACRCSGESAEYGTTQRALASSDLPEPLVVYRGERQRGCSHFSWEYPKRILEVALTSDPGAPPVYVDVVIQAGSATCAVRLEACERFSGSDNGDLAGCDGVEYVVVRERTSIVVQRERVPVLEWRFERGSSREPSEKYQSPMAVLRAR